MHAKVLAYMAGYMSKTAEDLELPNPSYLKALPGGGSKLEAGRVRALAEATGKDPSFFLKYPAVSMLVPTVLGSTAGGIAGAAMDGMRDPKMAQIGSLTGGALGYLVGALARVKASKDELASIDPKEVDKDRVDELIDEEANRSRVGGIIKDMFMGTGANNLGYSQQLQYLKNRSEKPEYPAAEAVDAVGKVIGPVGMIAQGVMGNDAVSIARKLNK